MNWKLIVPLGLTGILPPLAGYLLGLDANTAFLVSLALWTALAAAVWVPLTLRAGLPRVFVTLVLVGLVAGIAAGAVDVAFTGDPALLGVAVAVGAVWGAIFGAVALGIERMRGSRRPAGA